MTRARKSTTKSDEVLGYVRVSTSEQADSGLGLRAQRSAIRAECARHGWTLAKVYEDAGASAKSLSGRPALAEALDVLAQGEAGALVVSKLDRLARSVADFAGLVRRAEAEGWALIVVDLGVDMSTPTGGLLANVTASVAEWERQVIAQRTRDALKALKASGVKLGRPRLLDPGLADRIRAERDTGATLQAIADRLNAAGTTTPTGRSWSPALVRKVTLQEPVAA